MTAWRLWMLAAGIYGALLGCGATPEAPLAPPKQGQPGKDVMFIPQPEELVEKMLDLAAVTDRDYVIDLGSGDGRNVIAAARRGARALGVEYNPELVAYSRRAAELAGVGDKARFVEGDMYEADISQATALALFLIPTNLKKLTPKFLALAPGSRIIINTYSIPEWEPDEVKKAEDCTLWCALYLYLVPAQVAGTWRLPQGELRLEQRFQQFSGTLTTASGRFAVENGRLRGDSLRFQAGGTTYEGRVLGKRLSVKSPLGEWSATRP